MKCLVPKCRRVATRHHWPVSKANGGKSYVPLCRYHHNLAELHNQEVIDILIERAPIYWANSHVWEKYQGQYYKWLLKERGDTDEQEVRIQTVLQETV